MQKIPIMKKLVLGKKAKVNDTEINCLSKHKRTKRKPLKYVHRLSVMFYKNVIQLDSGRYIQGGCNKISVQYSYFIAMCAQIVKLAKYRNQ